MRRNRHKIEILILPTIYKDKMLFLASHISVMENNVNEKPQCVKFLTTLKILDL